MSNKKENPVCLRCSGPMQKGFFADIKWAEGEPAKLTPYNPPVRLPIIDDIWPPEPKGTVELITSSVTSYRCEICGYLELFANQPESRKYKRENIDDQ